MLARVYPVSSAWCAEATAGGDSEPRVHPIVFLIVLVAILVGMSWYKRASPAQRKQFTFRLLLFGGGIALLLLLVTGRLNPLFVLLGALIPIAHRVMGMLQLFGQTKAFHHRFKAAKGASPGQTSSVETDTLRMNLDHDSGAIDGEILAGPFKGKRLTDLNKAEQLDLYRYCMQTDGPSVSLLEPFLDRSYPGGWREQKHDHDSGGGFGSHGPNPSMSREEAMQILGVGADATEHDIVEAHRKLMRRMHPDRGGSNYLAIKINQAKDRLLHK